MHYNKAILGFASELVPLVIDGTKTLTYRLGTKYKYLEIGDTFFVEDSSSKTAFAELKLISKEETCFAKLLIDCVGHEIYASKAEQRATFEKFYKCPISDSDPVIILEFKVVKLI